jgi:hypothetical protein
MQVVRLSIALLSMALERLPDVPKRRGVISGLFSAT